MTHIYTHSIQFCSKRAFCHRRRRRARNRLRSRFVRLLIDSVLYTIWYMLCRKSRNVAHRREMVINCWMASSSLKYIAVCHPISPPRRDVSYILYIRTYAYNPRMMLRRVWHVCLIISRCKSIGFRPRVSIVFHIRMCASRVAPGHSEVSCLR